jgi:hypothetical protein
MGAASPWRGVPMITIEDSRDLPLYDRKTYRTPDYD